MVPANEVGEAAIRLIAPYVPIFLNKLGEGAIKKAGADAFDMAKELYQQIWAKAETDENTREAMEQLADAPENEGLQRILLERLIVLLESEQVLNQSLAEMLMQAGKLDIRRDISAESLNKSAAISGNCNTVNQTFNDYGVQVIQRPYLTGKASNVPSGSRTFVGRDEALVALHRHLSDGEAVAITAIQGMGGIGKTELAQQYANRYAGDYPGGMCWLRTQDADVASQIVTFSRVYLGLEPPESITDLPAQVAYCWSHWPEVEAANNATNDNVLVVYDDVTDYQRLAALLPPATGRFQILMTTRQQHLATTVTPFVIELLSEESALTLIKQILGTKWTKSELETAKAVCEWVGYLPLGLELVGRYLKQKPDVTFATLQQRLEAQRLGARALKAAYPGMTAQRGIVEAFELSWNTAEQIHKGAQGIACCLSLFALAPIPWTLAEVPVKDSQKEAFEEGRDVLVSLSLLQRVGTGLYQLHQLAREYFQAKLSQQEAEIPIKQLYCQIMVEVAQLVPQSPVQELQVWIAPSIPHIMEAATKFENLLDEKDLTWPFVALGRFYESQGDYEQAKTWYERSVVASKKRFGECHRAIASSLLNLSGLFSRQGLYKQAERLARQAVTMLDAMSEPPSLLANSLNNLGLIQIRQGLYDDADNLLRRGVKIHKTISPDGSPDEARAINHLGLLYFSKGNYQEAESFYRQSLEMYTKEGEVTTGVIFDVIQVQNNLAQVYSKQKRYEEAQPLFNEVLEVRRNLFKEEHPDIADSLNNIGGVYVDQKQYHLAEQPYQQALDIWLKLFGEIHPDVATSLNNLGGLRIHQEKYDEAEAFYNQALEIRQGLFQEGHWSVAESLDNLAWTKALQGSYEEAEYLCRKALNLYLDLLGEDHLDFSICLSNLAGIYVKQGNYQKAESLYFQAIHTWGEHLGREHPATKRGLQNFLNLVATAVKEGKHKQLSTHPVTQSYVRWVQSQIDEGETSATS